MLEKPVPLRVFGVGWPRTGTGTLCAALETLGFGPCFHLSRLLRMGDAAWESWEAIAVEHSNQTHRAELLLDALSLYQSAADVPAVAYWQDILFANKNGLLPHGVKFVLPRRRAEDWYASAVATVLAGWVGAPPISKTAKNQAEGHHKARMARIVWQRLFGAHRLWLPQDKGLAIRAYQQHTELVTSLIPSESLLLWDPQDGWEALCRFLEVRTPAESMAAFPWENRRQVTVRLWGV